MNQLPNALQFSHLLLKEAVSTGDQVIDGTIGNGNDTLLLAKLVGENGTVYGFDIQQQALQHTISLLEKNLSGLQNVQLYKKSHAEIDNVLDNNVRISAAIFNLGYLPGGDKSIITKSTSTLTALTTCLKKLQVGGLVVIVVYYGHPGGKKEEKSVVDFCQNLPQKNFAVLNYSFVNQAHEPPFVLAIQKLK
ncbi:class I SAM-dependent methyltransferase [Lentilactobacillus hilgardii]|uniref:class I SAM-dependent methyltransferase n=1 Tax=Lentilactobacillus hilgardii TaxID=1588 RepID=UPI00019C6669|nr:class I SAM-dependent methyltransferase [Lentilactobacillus hilgardii]EEI18431.1 putative rRNA methylase [Lentilactobacillus buchneri ATCC 11577]MCP9333061.1 methyltransferase domain-containing protein [Lentilactobacillus hilgardii]MCP9349676.1 methyltransferase domain-containing protein [Lentilactobacillus hilgardii]MCP9352544.1 methyltransferase domain-containing protein [Lentilactobacillus hilgardii]MCT3396596.1 methyltransferase domain-containing protein [Lentilactobacillus hilgardii]